MARMEKVSPEMLSLIERSLGAEADLHMTQGSAPPADRPRWPPS